MCGLSRGVKGKGVVESASAVKGVGGWWDYWGWWQGIERGWGGWKEGKWLVGKRGEWKRVGRGL